jgi:peptidoglycan/LPS O-acetylase OafA/YrhL
MSTVPHSPYAYRADIDGLRAIAVLAVVAYHVGIPHLHGGFIGVDIFYVISGFLITGLLLKDIDNLNRVDYLSFYARRARRILPTLLLVVVTVVLFGAVFLSRGLGEVQGLTWQAIATVAFSANFYFADRNADYFAGPSQFQPFLHMWSLAVEEQFYIVWPFLLGAAWFFCRRSKAPLGWLVAFLIAVLVVSGVFAVHLAASRSDLAFYSSAARAWELGLGGVMAICVSRNVVLGRAWAGAASIVGIVMICSGVILIKAGAVFPVPMAVWPVLGAVLLIAGNSGHPDNIVCRFLSTAPMVQVGLASYAWYLWHWPALAISRAATLGHPNLSRDIFLAIATLLLAMATLHFYERPLRFHSAFKTMSTQRLIGVFAGSVVVTLAIVAGVGFWAKYAPLTPLEAEVRTAKIDDPPSTKACLLPTSAGPAYRDNLNPACLESESNSRVIIWGDSFADRLSPAIYDWAKNRSPAVGIEQLTKAACAPLPHALPLNRLGPDYGCQAFNDLVLDRLKRIGPSKHSGAVIVGAWWPRATDWWALKGLPPISFDVGAANPREALQAFEVGLRAAFEALDTEGLRTLILLQTPILLDDENNFIYATDCIDRSNNHGESCSMSRATHEKFSEDVNSVIRKVAMEFQSVRTFDLTSILCDDRVCPARVNGTIAYIDQEHLTATMAHRLTDSFAPYLDWLVGK